MQMSLQHYLTDEKRLVYSALEQDQILVYGLRMHALIAVHLNTASLLPAVDC
jgi:hypothetical protein